MFMLQKKVCLLFLAGVTIGVVWRHYNLAPFPQLHHWKNSPTLFPERNATAIVLYDKTVPLFLDRLFLDGSGTNAFDGSYLIQIQRHRHEDIKLLAKKELIAYRLLSDHPANDNSVFADWGYTDIRVKVVGDSCTHQSVVKKKLSVGVHLLPAGGPVASSPLLIKVVGQDTHDLSFEVR
jgi:hypothetical protein